MKKNDLKSGYLIKVRSGEVGVVLLDTQIGDIISSSVGDSTLQTWGNLNEWTEDLRLAYRSTEIPAGDIIEVYSGPKDTGNSKFITTTMNGRELLWKRD
jgi:hypothetical protein